MYVRRGFTVKRGFSVRKGSVSGSLCEVGVSVKGDRDSHVLTSNGGH